MKKIVAITLFPTLLVACGPKASNQGIAVAEESDSLYMVNDSTLGDLQTYQYEGLLPDGDDELEYQLTIQSVGLNSDGTYTSKTTYSAPGNSNSKTLTDSGKKITLIGIPNDSTAVIYQLVSNKGGENINFIVEGDSALTRVDKEFKRLVTDLKHSIKRIK